MIEAQHTSNNKTACLYLLVMLYMTTLIHIPLSSSEYKKKETPGISNKPSIPINELVAMLALSYKNNERYYKNMSQPGFILAINTNREATSIEADFTKKLWGETSRNQDRPDLSYKNRPDIITLHTSPAVSPGRHIQANPTYCTVTEKNIRILFFQLPPTYDFLSTAADKERVNLLEKQLRNLLPCLRPGGQVVIEWLPFTIEQTYYDPLKNDLIFLPQKNLDRDRHANPFTGFFDWNIYRPAVFFAIQKNFPINAYPPCFITEAHKLTPLINGLLNFYASQGMAPRAELDKRLLLECEIMDQFINEKVNTIHIPEFPSIDIELFNNKVDHILFPSGKSFGLFTRISQIAPRYYKISDQEFITHSFCYILKSHLTVCLNGNLAIKCLENLGLEDVRLTVGKNTITQHNNAVLLSGFKKNNNE